MKKVVIFVSFMFIATSLFAVDVYNEPFTSDISGVTTVSVVGDQVWGWDSYDSGCAKMSGYDGTQYANEDWLITPFIDLTGYTSTKLDFREAINYESDVSTYETIWASDYAGSGDPNLASWSQLNVLGRSPGNTWTFNDVTQYDLSAYDGVSSLYVGFKYLSTDTNAGTWEIGEIVVSATGSTPEILVDPSTLTGFSYIEGSGPSAEQTFDVSGTNLTTDITLTAPTNYEISETSGSGFTSPITLTQTGGTVASTTIYVRLKAGLATGTYNNEDITASSTGATNKTVTCSGNVVPSSLPNAWINEFHYDNAGGDVGEFVEIAIENPGSYNLSDFIVVLYNGSGGASYGSETLDNFTAGDVVASYQLFTWYPTSIQNGNDGIALGYMGALIQFISYEGSFTATDGIADGVAATNLDVSETSSTPVGYSLQLIGIGTQYSDFTWTDPIPHTPGSENTGQTLPVELSSFTALFANEFVTIQWATASETDVIGFNIYRAREDNYEDADKVNMSLIPGHGTTTQPNEYSFTDVTADAYFTTYYYWLEAVNYGGTTDIYGSIQYDPVDIDGDGQLNTIFRSTLDNVFPNPVQVGENITFDFMIGGLEGTLRSVSLNIYNIKGELVQEVINEDMMVNDYTKTWRVNDIANGVYFYQLKTENYQETKKLLIQ